MIFFDQRYHLKQKSRFIETSFGKTHVLEGGNVKGRPMVILHGALASSAHILSELRYLADHFYLYAIDVIGQSVMSEDRHLSVHNNDYGLWLNECTGSLGLSRYSLIGVSFGGFVSMRTAAADPEALENLVLLVPAGLVNGRVWESMGGYFQTGFPDVSLQKLSRKETSQPIHRQSSI